ncbi:MAG TPA: hypothetical protein V6D17_19745 [Candidatus Obscuribacterales bacterium]
MKQWWRKLLPEGERLQMPSPRITKGFLLIYGLLVVLDLIRIAASLYSQAPSHATPAAVLFDVLKVCGVMLVAYAATGCMFFFMLSLFTSVIIPDAVAAYRALRRGIAAIPGAWTRFWAGFRALCASARKASGNFFSWLGALPARLAALTLEEWLIAPFALGMLAIMAGLLYLGWGWANTVNSWLPSWMQADDWIYLFLIDWLICIIPLTVAMTLWGEIFRFLVRRLRNWRERNEPK